MSSINASIVPWRVVPRDAERQRCPEICIPPSARGQRSDDAARQPNRHFFLVLDEINRGDLPRIFGELITTIEYDKRDRRIKLPVTGSSFAVPRNVFLIGTMNTADRSISLMDTVLRRRFGFVELMPDSTLLAGRKAGGLLLGAWLDALNTRLRRHLKRDARNPQIGHAYLMPPQPMRQTLPSSSPIGEP